MKKLLQKMALAATALSVFAPFASVPFAQASGVTWTVKLDPTAHGYYQTVLAAADRLVTLQNSNGSWDWVVTNATGPTAQTFYNITGVTAQGLLDAYALDHNASYLTAAEKAGDFIVGTAISPTQRQNAFNVTFLQNLASVEPDATKSASYSTQASDILASIFTAENYWSDNAGSNCTASGCSAEQLLAAYQNYRTGSEGIIAWDLMPFVVAEENLGTSDSKALAQSIETQIVTEAATYTASTPNYALGLAAEVVAANAVSDPNLSSYVSALTSAQNSDNSFGQAADGQIQSSAYALMALSAAGNSSNAVAATVASYLQSKFGYSSINGWEDTSDSSGVFNTEYSEEDSEAAHALFSFFHQPNTFYTIGDAVSAASSGDTISVGAGTYHEDLTINKALTLQGPQVDVAGKNHTSSEAVVDSITIGANSVTINGFSFDGANSSIGQVNVSSSGAALSGVVIKDNIFNGYSSVGLPTYNAGNILIQGNLFENAVASSEAIQIKAGNTSLQGCNGSEVSDNVFTAATNNGGADINFSCTDSNSANVTVSGNISTGTSGGSSFVAFSGVNDGILVSKNTATTDGSSIFFFGNVSGTAGIDDNKITNGGGNAISIHGGDITSDVANTGTFNISNNTLTGNARAVFVAGSALDPAAHVAINGNDLSGNTNIDVQNSSSVSIDATKNYWGAATGPTADNISGDITTDPFLTSADGSLVVINSSSTTPVTVDVSKDQTDAKVDLSALVTTGTDTTTAVVPTTININADTNSGSVQVQIPSGVTITSDSSWDGSITPPKTSADIVPPVDTDSGHSVSYTTIDVGSSTSSITFNKAVRLLFTGKAGSRAAFRRDGTTTEIATVCTADTQSSADSQLADGQECKMDVGSDLVIWTKHFTEFIAFTVNTVAPTSGGGGGGFVASSGGSSANSSNSGSGNSTPSNPATSSTPTTPAPAVPNQGGRVLGANTASCQGADSDGTIVKGAGQTVYIIEGCELRPFATMAELQTYGAKKISKESATDMTLPVGAIMRAKSDIVAYDSSDKTYYFIEADGVKRAFASLSQLRNSFFKNYKIFGINLKDYTVGSAVVD